MRIVSTLFLAGCLVAFSGLVLWLGTPNFSASRSYTWLLEIMRLIDPDVVMADVVWVHGLLRKSMHVVEYAVLALLAFRAAWLSFGNLLVRVAATAIIIAVGVAAIDEASQASYETRTGSAFDVLLDGSAGVLAVCAAVMLRRRQIARRTVSAAPPQ